MTDSTFKCNSGRHTEIEREKRGVCETVFALPSLLPLFLKASPACHLAGVVLGGGCFGEPRVPSGPLGPLLPQPAPLLAPLEPVLLVLALPRELEALQEQVLGELVELHVQVVELLDAAAHGLADVHVGGARAVDLREGRDEAQVERPLEQVLRFALELRQAVEGHVLEVGHGAGQEDVVALALVHG